MPLKAAVGVANWMEDDLGENTTQADLRPVVGGSYVAPGYQVKGITLQNNPTHTFTASDQDPSRFQSTQIWELANSIAYMTGNNPGTSPKDGINVPPGPSNKEPGQKLFDCYNRANPTAPLVP